MKINSVKILFKKEIKEKLSSPMIYIVGALFSLLMGWLFFNYIVVSSELSEATIINNIVRPIFGNMNFMLIILIPIICMNSFSEEKKNKTLGLLLTSKLTELDIVFAKFLGMLVSSVILIIPTLVFPAILFFAGFRDIGVIAGSYIGIIFCIACYVATSLFFSSLSQNSIVSSLLSFVFLLLLALLVIVKASMKNYLLANLIGYFSIATHFEAFARGSIISFNFVYFLTYIGLFLFITKKNLEARNL